MAKTKTKYPNVYFDDVRNKYEYRKMIHGALLFGRANTPKDAYAALIEATVRNEDPKPKKKKKILPTLNQVLVSYLKECKDTLKITTYYKRKHIVNLYYKDRFRNVPIDKLVDKDFQKWYNFIKKRNIICSSKNQYLTILKSIFEYIRIHYGYECLYVQRLHAFKDYSISEPVTDYRVFTLNDFKLLYPTLNSYDQLLLLTLFLFGLRSGELLALTKQAVIYNKGLLSIYQSVSWKTEKIGYVLTTPKSKTSKRLYPMPAFYMNLMKQHIENEKIKDNEFIFFSPLNKKDPLSSSSLQRKLNEWSKVVGYHLHPHLFRHSSVSQLYASGMKIEDIKRLMGHSSEQITKEVYLHQTEETNQALSDFLNRLLI